jgi:hypothetical protein
MDNRLVLGGWAMSGFTGECRGSGCDRLRRYAGGVGVLAFGDGGSFFLLLLALSLTCSAGVLDTDGVVAAVVGRLGLLKAPPGRLCRLLNVLRLVEDPASSARTLLTRCAVNIRHDLVPSQIIDLGDLLKLVETAPYV